MSAQDATSQPAPQPIVLGSTPAFYSLFSGGTAFYSVAVPLPFSGLHIVMSTAVGNSNLYVSVQPPTGPWAQPQANASDYFSASMLAAEMVDIYPTDPAVVRNCARTSYQGTTCTFVIAVTCDASVAASNVWLSAYVDGAFPSPPPPTPLPLLQPHA